MGDKSIILVVVILIVSTILVGCSSPTPPPFKPDITVNVDTDAMAVKSGVISDNFVTVDITRLDSSNTGTSFTLKFDNKNTVYAVDANGNNITQITSKELKGANSKDTLQFKVIGTKTTEDESAQKSLTIHLIWNDITYLQKNISITVQ